MLKWIGGAIVTMLLMFGLVTYLALELGDVLTVATTNHNTGEPRKTHIWFVQEDGQVFLEAGNPSNPWVQDIQTQPTVELTGDAITGQYDLHIVEDDTGHHKARSLMRAKYGWRDVWVAALFDTSESKLVSVHKQQIN